MRRWFLLAALLAVLPAALLTACAGEPAASTEAGEQIVTAFVGDLAASASASGKVLPQRSAALAVQTPGRVERVLVQEGDVVEAGDALVQLERDDLQAAVDSARQDLAIQQANLDDLLAEPLPKEIAAAEAAVASAKAQLQDLNDGPRPEEVAAAEANLAAAQAGVWASSEQLGEVQNSTDEAGIARARAQLAAAQLELARAQQANEDNPVYETHQAMLDAQEAVDVAQAELDALLAGPNEDSVGAAQAGVGASAAQRDAREADLNVLLNGASAAQLAAAEATLAQAEASLDALESGPSDDAVHAAEAQVEQARLAVEDAEAALEEATLRAPFAAVVTAVHVSEGEVANGVAIELLDADSLEVVLTVDEADVGALAVGQPATITLETWPDEQFESEIVKIAPAASDSAESALVSYAVYLHLEQTTRPVRAGMTAHANLLTAQREDVLLLPNQAIVADRDAGKYYVDLVVDGGVADGDSAANEAEIRVERVEVTIGLRDDRNTQIVAGLEEGDRVRVRTAVPNGLNGAGNGGPFGDDD